MTEAPERIWALMTSRGSLSISSDGQPLNANEEDIQVLYLRADLVPDWSSDMDAAPKDGTFVVVYSPDAADPEWNDPGVRVSNWEAGQWQGFPWTAKGPYAVTHWMPLPAPPKEGE